MTLSWVLWIVVIGAVAGAVARLLLPGRDRIGFLGTIAVGIVGALLGWWIGGMLVGVREVEHHPWLSAIAGSVVVLFVLRSATYRRGMFRRRRPLRHWTW